MLQEKTRFLKDESVARLQTLPPQTKPLWGKMNVQQMVEHFTDAVRLASGAFSNIAL